MTRIWEKYWRTSICAVLAVVCVGVTLPAWAAQDASSRQRLERAIRLYEEGAYKDAQLILKDIDSDLLSPADKERLAEHIELVERAIVERRKARAELEEAEAAIASGDLDFAKSLLDRVLQNEFATDQLKEDARNDLAIIARAERQRIKTEAASKPATPQIETEAETEPTPHQRADELIQQGTNAMQRGSYEVARDCFERALELVPGHPSAVKGLEQLEMHRRVEAAPPQEGVSLIDRMRHKRAILWQRAVAAYRTAEQEIHESVADNRYEQAQRTLQLARETIEGARQYAEPLAKYESLKAELAALAEMVNTQQRDYDERRAVELREELRLGEQTRLETLEADKNRQIDLLMEQVNQKREDRDYYGAVQVLRQIIVIDPKNAEAEWLMEQLDDIASVRAQTESRHLLEKETRSIFVDTEEAKIPWHEEINYPDNWLDLIQSPYRRTPGEYPLETEDSDFEESFRGRIPEVSFNQLELEKVFEKLADQHDVNIVPNWPDLASAGITRDTPLTLKLRDVPVRTVLMQVLDQLQSLSTTPLGFVVRDAIVKVATEDFLNSDVFVRVYPVQDLIHPIEKFDDAPEFDLRKTRTGEIKSSGQKPIFEDESRYAYDDLGEGNIDNFANRELAELVKLIQDHVAPGSWRSQGGDHARINARVDGNLVITQTTAAHQEIFNLLDQLRQDRAIQIAIEARFLTVSSNFLEDMGIDLNIVLNNGNAGFDRALIDGNPGIDPVTGGLLLLPRSFGRLGFGPSVAPFGTTLTGTSTPDQPFLNPVFVPSAQGSTNRFTPIPITSGSGRLTDPSRETSDVPGSFAGKTLAPALQIAGSFLDNIQVDFLLRATQADSRTSTLIAPKLILTNGQQSWIAITEQQNYVSELDPVVVTGAAAQRPLIATLDTGAVLNVQATASPDRRYVTLNLQPGVGRLVAVNTFQFSGGPSTGVGASGFVQLPIIQRQQVKTTVTIPDGGTLLVGGQKLTFEKETDAGVPVLSKIPILKRLYSSRGIIKDEQVLLILIKPQILIQEEQEELAHPTLGSLR